MLDNSNIELTKKPDETIKGYRQLSQNEISHINKVKEHGNKLEQLIYELEEYPRMDCDRRWLNIGKAQLQQGIMALVRAIAKPDGF